MDVCFTHVIVFSIQASHTSLPHPFHDNPLINTSSYSTTATSWQTRQQSDQRVFDMSERRPCSISHRPHRPLLYLSSASNRYSSVWLIDDESLSADYIGDVAGYDVTDTMTNTATSKQTDFPTDRVCCTIHNFTFNINTVGMKRIMQLLWQPLIYNYQTKVIINLKSPMFAPIR